MNKNRFFVFLYGTLKSSQPNHDELKHLTGNWEFIGKARTVKKWPLVIASRFNIPYLLYAEGKGQNVIGELYSMDGAAVESLDSFECHPHYYERKEEEVIILEHAEIVKANIYFLTKITEDLLKLECFEEYNSEGSHGLKYNTAENITSPDAIDKS